jgi:hypothetical protein
MQFHIQMCMFTSGRTFIFAMSNAFLSRGDAENCIVAEYAAPVPYLLYIDKKRLWSCAGICAGGCAVLESFWPFSGIGLLTELAVFSASLSTGHFDRM